MSAMQRTKGQAGEREVANILSSALGVEISRNWQAQFDGGAFDLIGLEGWAVEVKRAKVENKKAWWQQAVKQAEAKKLIPALVYRIDGVGKGLEADEKWQVMIPFYALYETPCHHQPPVQMTLRTWIYLLVQQGLLSKNRISSSEAPLETSEAAVPF